MGQTSMGQTSMGQTVIYIGVHFQHESLDQREAVRGICQYIRHRRLAWRFSGAEPRAEKTGSAIPPDAWIIATREQAVRDYCLDAGVPTVNLALRFDDPLLPQVWHDERLIGQMAAEHLVERGFRRFGWFGGGEGIESQRRREGFVAALAERGYDREALAIDIEQWATFGEDAGPLKSELARDPRPIGCLAYTDGRALRVIRSCEAAGIDVPQRIAIVGVNNEEWNCEQCFPALSSIELDRKQRGWAAADAIATMLDTGPFETPLPPVPPVRLVARESTGYATTGDPIVDKAVAFIHARASRDVRVDDVVHHVKTNRRTLSWKFRKVLDTTPHQWILKARIDALKELAITTDMDVESLAEAAGFVSKSHMSRVFRKVTGMTLTDYRRQSIGTRLSQ